MHCGKSFDNSRLHFIKLASDDAAAIDKFDD